MKLQAMICYSSYSQESFSLLTLVVTSEQDTSDRVQPSKASPN
jgi:hypothetical protein